jgi:hypothetical protein
LREVGGNRANRVIAGCSRNLIDGALPGINSGSRRPGPIHSRFRQRAGGFFLLVPGWPVTGRGPGPPRPCRGPSAREFPLAERWTAHGKTGNGHQLEPDGKPDHDRQFGWFVGWAEKAGRRVVFARLVKDDAKIEEFASFRARDSMLADLPRLLESR